MEFVLGDPPYDIWRDQSSDTSDYLVFALEYIKDMVKMLDDVINPRARGHLFYSTLQFAPWYKSLVCHFREELTITGSYHEESGSESQEGLPVDKHVLFEIEISALHYNRAVCNYQKNTAAKRAVHTSVEEVSIHFCRLRWT